MPTLELVRNGKKRHEIDMHQFAALIRENRPAHAFVEMQQAMPPHLQQRSQGLTSTFQIGKGYGVILGVLAAFDVPITIVVSRVWKKALQVPAAKDGARARASQLMPHLAHNWTRVKDDGRAEASLIALFGSRQMTETSRPLPKPPKKPPAPLLAALDRT